MTREVLGGGQVGRKGFYILGGFFIISLILFITGCVLIGVGSHKLHQKQKCPSCPSLLGSVAFSTSWDPSIPWTDDYYNPESAAYQILVSRLNSEIPALFATFAPSSSPVTIVINGFEPYPTAGTVFYATYVFNSRIAPISSVRAVLANRGWASTVNVDPLTQCGSILIPNFTSSNTTNPPATLPTNKASTNVVTPLTGIPMTTSSTTTHVVPAGAYCDATINNVQTTFIVDVARPISGSLDDKLSMIRNYLTSYNGYIGVTSSKWLSTRFDLVYYTGAGANTLGSCIDNDCWRIAINNLNSSIVNPTQNDYHTLTNGLQYVLNRLSAPTVGQGKSIIIITDGYDLTNDSPNILAADLKLRGFDIGVIVATSTDVTRNMLSNVATNPAHYYLLDSISWLTNPSVFAVTAPWTCYAYYPTAPPPTNPSTKLPLVTSVAPVTNQPATTPQPNGQSSCTTDVLFLLEDSATLSINNGFTKSLVYMQNLANQISNNNNNSRFAYLSFNTGLVSKSSNYLSVSDFSNSLQKLQSSPSASDVSVGFSLAANYVGSNSRYAQSTVRSLVVFLTAGTMDNSTSIVQATANAHSIRSLYSTEIIAIGVDEALYAQMLTQEVVEYGVKDGYVSSQFIGTTRNDLTGSNIVNSTVNSIICLGGGGSCSTHFVFAIEVSSIEENDFIDVERNIITGVINTYASFVSPSGGKVSVVYYSSQNDSGILFEMDSSPIDANNQVKNAVFNPLGGSSNIDYGFQQVLQALQQDKTGNAAFVTIIGRGVSATNSTSFSNQVKGLANLVGVSLGPYADAASMAKFTVNAIDGNSMLVTDSYGRVNAPATAQAILQKLLPISDNFVNNPVCQPIPQLPSACQQFDDVIMVLHASTEANWHTIKQFVANLMVPSLYGSFDNKVVNMGSPVNLGIVTYFGNIIDIPLSVDTTKTSAGMRDQIMNIPYTNVSSSITNLLSAAYRATGQQILVGRQMASKMIVVITDTIDIADYQSSYNERANFPSAYVYGIRIGGTSVDIVPGQNDGMNVDQIALSPDNTRTSRSIAIQLTSIVCRNYVIPTMPPTTTPAPRTTPAPIPAVKARDIWPDITILIDVSNQTIDNFENIRSFLQTTFRDQFFIGTNGSRFTVATFDDQSTNVLCNFNQIQNYWNLYECLGPNLSYLTVSPSSNRDINQALNYLNKNIYSSIKIASSGFEPLNENYLYLFSLGSSLNDFSAAASKTRSYQVRTIGVDITQSMTSTELSRLGPQSYVISNWRSQTTQDALRDAIVSQTTSRPSPSLSSFFSDFYFVVDQSATVNNDIQNVRTFVKNFVNLLTVSDHRSRVSIIPYSDYVATDYLPLQSSATNINNWISTWSSIPAGSSNVQTAISNVVSQITSNLGNSTTTRMRYIIYLVGADTTSNFTADSVNQLGVSLVLNYNTKALYAQQLTNDKSRYYRLTDSTSLDNWAENRFPVGPTGRNPMNQFFYRLFDEQYQSDSTNFPTVEVAADIMIFLDETGMSDNDFANMQQFLIDFINSFTVSSSDTQFALQAFNGDLIPEAGFHFSDSSSNQDLVNRVKYLHLEKNPNTAPADLTGAIEQGLIYFMDPNNGWREAAETYTIILSNSMIFYQDSKQTAAALQVSQNTKVFLVETTGKHSDFAEQFVNTGFIELVDSPQYLKASSGVGADLISAVTKEYAQQVYPSPVPFKKINADFIFLIDNTGTSQTQYAQIKKFLSTFINSVLFTEDTSRFSIVNYNQLGVVSQTSWYLSSYTSLDHLDQVINAMSVNSNGNPPNLHSAIQYFASPDSPMGITTSRPVFVTAILQSQNISSEIPALTTKNININYFTYALQIGQNSQEFSYTAQFLGSDYDNNFLYVSDLSVYDSNTNETNPFYNYNKYIQSGYGAWLQTH